MPGDYIDSFYRRSLSGETTWPALEDDTQTEVAVIGGGLAGLTCALELAGRGRKVCLLEAQRVGWGASGRNGGSVSPSWSARDAVLQKKLGQDHFDALFRLSMEGVDMVRERALTLAGDAAQVVPGHLKLSTYDNADAFQRSCEAQARRYDRPLHYLDRSAVRALLDSPRYHQGLYAEDGFHFHPLNYCQALARECARLGVAVHEHSAVQSLQGRQGDFLLDTGKARVTASTVVICTGGYTGGLVPALQRAYLPIATYVMLTEPLGERLQQAIRSHAALGDTRRAGNYYRLVENGRRLLWGGHITTRVSDPRNITAILQRELALCYPQLRDAPIALTWSGLMAYARHMMPQIGQLAPGLWHCTAFGGHGVNTTAIGARCVAEAITGESDRWRRFAPFGLAWNGGPLGRAAVQLTYWRYQMLDRARERRSAA
ncbi:MAG: FAD-binding oxidoreductase [Castellaniella sp.]